VAEGSPTVRRRELGAVLRRLREEREMSVKQVTEHLLCSPSKISRIETGQRGATLRDVRDLCDFYGVRDEAERERLMTLAREGKQQGWWQSYDLPYSMYVGLESEAVSIKDYDSAVVPGLLQTPDYARAMFKSPLPEPDLPEITDEVIDQRVAARLRRQRLLAEEGHKLDFWAILDEAVLHRTVGSATVMREQLRHLADAAKLSNVTIQVIPYSVGAHPALDSTFNILTFAGAVPEIVYVEGLVGKVYVERPEDVDRYRRVFAHLSEMALTPEKSIKLTLSYADSALPGYRLGAVARSGSSPSLHRLPSGVVGCRQSRRLAMCPESASSGELKWRKAARSLTNGECVEVARADGRVAVRDSKLPGVAMLKYSAQSWQTFIEQTKECQ
jgi:Domain of unknown function (DUF5753)/Helix-turn-helix domain/Domain of unknown function (DUF397)